MSLVRESLKRKPRVRTPTDADAAVDQQGDDGPDHRADDAGGLQEPLLAVLVEEDISEETADERSDNAEQDGAADTDRVATRHQQAGKRSGDQADDDQRDDETEHGTASLGEPASPSGSAVP